MMAVFWRIVSYVHGPLWRNNFKNKCTSGSSKKEEKKEKKHHPLIA